jgi:4'-phosphopantetheinyl transferase
MTLPSLVASDAVCAWYAQTSDLAAEPRLARALTWLQPAERVRYDRYRDPNDRLMFLLGRVMARWLVGRAIGVPPTAWRWDEGPHGCPEIGAPASPLRFNLAHSAGLVVCALASGRDVGVDVESLTRRPTDPALVHRYCSPAEVADIEAQPPDARQRRFLVYWTLKEAYLKARGLGISVRLTDVGFSLEDDGAQIAFHGSLAGTDTRWAFHLTQPTEGHLVAVAASRADGGPPHVTVERLLPEMLD